MRDWLIVWRFALRGYLERRRLRRQNSSFYIRRWFSQQPVIRQRPVLVYSASTNSRSRITRSGVSVHDEDCRYIGLERTEAGILREQQIRR